MNIIKSELSDAKALLALVNSAYRGDTAKKGWTSEADLLGGTRIDLGNLQLLLQDPNTFIYKFLSEDNEIVGCILLEIKEHAIYLGMLTVKPTLQNSGIGKQLLQFAEKYAQEHQKHKIEMTVISKRTELIQWYNRNGYQDTGERKPFPELGPAFGIPKEPLEFVVLSKKIQ